MVYIYAGVFIDIFEFHLVSEKQKIKFDTVSTGPILKRFSNVSSCPFSFVHLASGGGKMSITRQLAKNALEKQQENQSSSQSNVVDDHELLSDKNESYLGRNSNSS